MTTLWLVLLVFLGPANSEELFISQSVVIDTQPTREACEAKRDEVWAGMRKAYPGDESFTMACKCIAKEGVSCPKSL